MRKRKQSEHLEQYEAEILTIEQAPEWQIDNFYLKSGFRRVTTFRQAVRSIFQQHNDTLNIWTHLLGALFFLILFFCLFQYQRNAKEFSEKVKNELKKFYNESKFKKKFVQELDHKLQEFKNKAEKKNKSFQQFQTQIEEFLNSKIQKYKEKIIKKSKDMLPKDIKIEFELFKLQIKEKIMNLKHNQQSRYWQLQGLVEDWFNEHRKLVADKLDRRNKVDRFPIIVYSLSAFACFLFSTVFHLLYPVSKYTNDFLQRLDMAGISILIFGSTFGMISYVIPCRPYIYWGTFIITLISCSTSFMLTMMPFMHTAEHKYKKGILFIVVGVLNGLSCMISFFVSQLKGRADDLEASQIAKEAGFMGMLYIIGALFYITHVPERFFPHKFDIWLNSHTIFHIFVFFAALSFYFTIEKAYEMRLLTHCI